MVFKEGNIPWNKGKKCDWLRKKNLIDNPMKKIEIRRKVSETKKGVKHTEEWKKKLSENAKINPNYGMKNKKHSEKTKNKISINRKGKKAWNKGRPRTKEEKIKISQNRSGLGLGNTNGFKKGDNPWNKLEFRIPYPYEFNNILKEQIRQRDNYECRLCNIEQEEMNERLIVHHIDFDKQNNSPENLISLCRSCHGKVHCANNLIWRRFFQNIQLIKLQEAKA